MYRYTWRQTFSHRYTDTHTHTHTEREREREFNQNTKETGVLKDTIFISDYCHIQEYVWGAKRTKDILYVHT